MVTQRLLITGKVQGVGYRDGLQREAVRLGVAGWVRNRRDGGVEALLQGEDAAVAELISWAHKGPPAARVHAVCASPPGPALDRPYCGFEVWPTV